MESKDKSSSFLMQQCPLTLVGGRVGGRGTADCYLEILCVIGFRKGT
jgi:hypothetical protein